uniref:Putative ring finger n=1 Tax=Triatoma infestans TaxID=30076 RepID=A0A023EYX1_TRIIF
MHIQCNICSDLITQTAVSDIIGLTCGHIFHGLCLRTWLDRSATCPQCRARITASKQHKIYLTLAPEPEGQDIISLTRAVDNLKHDLKMKTLDCNKLTKELNEHKVTAAELLKEVKEFKIKETAIEHMKLQIHEQKKFANNRSRELNEAKLKIVALERELKQYQTLKSVISSAKKEVDVGIDVESLETPQLIFLLGTFKKDITRLSKMDEDLKKALSKSESSNFSLTKKLNDLQESLELKDRIIESLKDSLAKETSLKKNLEEIVGGNYSKSETLKCSSCEETQSSSIQLFHNKNEQNKSTKKSELLDEKQNELLTVRKMTNILSVSKPVFRITSDRLRGIDQIKSSLNQEIYNYDGMGGHSRVDVFPSGCRPKPGITKAPKIVSRKKVVCPPKKT